MRPIILSQGLKFFILKTYFLFIMKSISNPSSQNYKKNIKTALFLHQNFQKYEIFNINCTLFHFVRRGNTAFNKNVLLFVCFSTSYGEHLLICISIRIQDLIIGIGQTTAEINIKYDTIKNFYSVSNEVNTILHRYCHIQ